MSTFFSAYLFFLISRLCRDSAKYQNKDWNSHGAGIGSWIWDVDYEGL